MKSIKKSRIRETPNLSTDALEVKNMYFFSRIVHFGGLDTGPTAMKWPLSGAHTCIACSGQKNSYICLLTLHSSLSGWFVYFPESIELLTAYTKGCKKKTRPLKQTNFAQHYKPNQTTIEACMI